MTACRTYTAQRGLVRAVAPLGVAGRLPLLAGATGQRLARDAVTVVSVDDLKPCYMPQSPCTMTAAALSVGDDYEHTGA